MSELPKGWAGYQLGEVNEYVSGTIDPSKTPETTFELYSVPSFPSRKPEILTGRGIGSTKQIVSEGDVLLCKINPRINRVWQVGPSRGYPQIASSEWIVIRQPAFNSRFLVHQLSEAGFRDRLCAEVSGVGGSLTRAQPKKVATYQVLIAPEREQARIAQALDGLLAQVDTLKARLDALPALIKRFRQSVLSETTKSRPNVYSIGDDIHDSNRIQTDIPHWKSVKISEITENEKYAIGIGPFGSNLKVSDYREYGHPLVFVRDIRSESFGDNKTKYVDSEKFAELIAHTVKPGDILITKMGDPPGDVAIYPENRPEAVITSDCIKLRVNKNTVSARFIYHLMKSEGFRAKIIEISAGVAQQKVSLTNFKDIKISIPDLDAQEKIADRIDLLMSFADQLEARLADARARVDTLTQSILTKAFRGELVPQDPADEPASVLLERIKAQRAAVPKPKRGRKSV